jgi:uncharacterized protein YjeT (DUF2065 family)
VTSEATLIETLSGGVGNRAEAYGRASPVLVGLVFLGEDLVYAVAPHEVRKLLTHTVDLRPVHEQLAGVCASSFADLAHEHEALQMQYQVVELAEAVRTSTVTD